MRPNSKSAQIRRFLKRVALLALAVLSAAIISPAHGQSETATKKIIIDTDPGTDDALAILLAANSPELDIRAITIVAGNVTADLGLENALKVMSLAGRCEVAPGPDL